MALRKRLSPEEYFEREKRNGKFNDRGFRPEKKEFELNEDNKAKLKELLSENEGTRQAILLDRYLNEIKRISVRTLANYLKKASRKPAIIVIDGTVTLPMLKSAEDVGCKTIVGDASSLLVSVAGSTCVCVSSDRDGATQAKEMIKITGNHRFIQPLYHTNYYSYRSYTL